MENLHEKERTENLYNKLLDSMRAVKGDTAKNAEAARKVSELKAEYSKAMESGEMTDHHRRIGKALKHLKNAGELPPSSLASSYMDGDIAPKKKGKYKKGTPKTAEKETPEGREERVKKLEKKYEKVGKKTERPLEDIGDDEIKEDIDIIIAKAYLENVFNRSQEEGK